MTGDNDSGDDMIGLEDDPVSEIIGLLADHDDAATAPPGDLWDALLVEATTTREGPLDPPPAISSRDAFAASVEQLRNVLLDLSPDEWLAPTTTPYGRVRDLVAHLVGIEAVTVGWMTSDVLEVTDHVAVTEPARRELANTATGALLDAWLAGTRLVLDTEVDPAKPVIANDIPSDVDNMLVMRTFEVWAHTDDVLAAVGRDPAPLDPGRAALMSSRLMSAVGIVMQLQGDGPDITVRAVLTGPGGGCHDLPLTPGAPTTPAMRIVADVTDLCRLAGHRLDRADLDAEIEGDPAVAERILEATRAFARD